MNVRLVHQDERDIARDPPREAIGQPERRCVRQHGHIVGSGYARRERGDCRPQPVHRRLALRRHAPRRLGVEPDRRGR